MVVVQKKKTMPNNKKIMKEVYLPELALKVNMKKMGKKAADTGMKGAKIASAKTRLINMAKQNKKFKDDKSFQKARDRELKNYKKAVAEGIKEGMSEKASMVGKIKKINQKTMKQKDAAFKLRSGNKPSIAKLMGLVDKALGRKRKVEKFPEGGKQTTITNRKGEKTVKYKGGRGTDYKTTRKFDAQGREILSKTRLQGERSKLEFKYSDPSKYERFPNKPLEAKLTKRKGLFGKKTVKTSKREPDNRVFFGR